MTVKKDIIPILSTLFYIIQTVLWVFTEFARALWLNLTNGLFMKGKDLRGKVVVITGSAMGVGREIAMELSKKGVDTLVLWDMEETENHETAKLCNALGTKTFDMRVNLLNNEEIEIAAKNTLEQVERVDIVINNAGVARADSFLNKTNEEFKRTVTINAISHATIARCFLPHFIENRSGHFVCMSSAAGLIGCHDFSDYSTSKSAAIALWESLENECFVNANDFIKFTTACMGYIQTRLCTEDNLPAASGKSQMTPNEAAKVLIRAVELEQGIVMKPGIFYLIHALKGIIPRRILQRILVFLLWNEQAKEARK